MDEDVQREYGDLILAWFRSGATDDRALSFGNLFLYGGLFDVVAQWIVAIGISPWGVFETRHALTAFIAMLGVVATWKTAKLIAGAQSGFIAAVFLALTPAWIGHGFFNPKDIPFATAVAFVHYATVRICTRPTPLAWRDALSAGVYVGLALAVRPGGMFLLGYPLVAAFAGLALAFGLPKEGDFSWKAALASLASVTLKLGCSLAVAWALMLSAWPWAQVAPWKRPFQAASEAAHFAWRNMVLFNGERIWSYELPSSYLPTWFRITLPDSYGLAAVCALFSLCTIRRSELNRGVVLSIAFLMMSIIAPYVGVVMTKPIVYDAHRHFLFILPSMAVLAGLAVFRTLSVVRKFRWLSVVTASAFVFLAAVTVFDMSRLHPYEYVYFNRAFGGLPAAEGRFETDYWGAANREGLAWVMTNITPPKRKRLTISTCHADWQLDYYIKSAPGFKSRFKPIANMDEAQIFVASTRDRCHEKPGEVVHEVARLGVTLLRVLRR